MKIIKMILVFYCLLNSGLASADEWGPDAKSFEFQCQAPHEALPIYSRDQSSLLDKQLYKTLAAVAFDQAQVWADTILEGDFHAAGQTRLDQVEALYSGEILIGYRITYSEKAWDLSQCEYYEVPAEKRDQALAKCAEGRISEASFVSPSFRTYIRDSNQFAEFQATE